MEPAGEGWGRLGYGAVQVKMWGLVWSGERDGAVQVRGGAVQVRGWGQPGEGWSQPGEGVWSAR